MEITTTKCTYTFIGLLLSCSEHVLYYLPGVGYVRPHVLPVTASPRQKGATARGRCPI